MSKFSPEDLRQFVFSRTGAANPDLLVGPGYGEDAAAIRVDEGTMVLSCDPISLAAERIGTLGVAIAANDVATCGGVPEWLVCTILLPREDPGLLDEITAQLDEAAQRLDITIIGGHTETVSGLARPLLSLTCMGVADRYVATSTAEADDRIVLTKGAGIEATAVLATDFREDLAEAGVDESTLDRAATFFDDLSIIPEAAPLSPVATAMHDPTEGGVLNGLVELAHASEARVVVDDEAIPVRAETHELCGTIGVDPLRVLGSGALLATLPQDAVDDALEQLTAAGVEATVIGRVEGTAVDRPHVALDGDVYDDAVTDQLYDLWD
ncbi:MAG: AIR synthase family protein [Halobacteriota archaeon]